MRPSYVMGIVLGVLLAWLLGIHRCPECEGRGWVIEP